MTESLERKVDELVEKVGTLEVRVGQVHAELRNHTAAEMDEVAKLHLKADRALAWQDAETRAREETQRIKQAVDKALADAELKRAATIESAWTWFRRAIYLAGPGGVLWLIYEALH